MRERLTIIFFILIWLISLVEPSGWGMMMHIDERVNLLITAVSIIFYVEQPQFRLSIKKQFFWATVAAIAVIPYLVSGKWDGASYLVAFLATYLASQCVITGFVVKYSSLIITCLGIYILNVYLYKDTLSGWNDNAISMIGLFSYLYFTIFLISKKVKKSTFWKWNIVTIIYLEMLFMTECRSGMVFSVIAVVSIIFSRTTRKILYKPKLRLLILNFPVILSLIVILISETSLYHDLNMWSITNTHKGIFDGRETLWLKAYEQLAQSNYLGVGKFMINYHNSGVAAIAVFGVLGYICWILFFSKMLTQMQPYLKDDIVFGSMVAFVMIYLQQSLDLGFISPVPNLIPYAILGLGLGRVNYLKNVWKRLV